MSEADKIIESLKNSGRKVEEFYTGNKGSDKNVGSTEKISQTSDKNVVTEEDIRVINKIISFYKNIDILYNKEIQALERVLAEREQDKKRIKELEEENAMLKKADNIARDVNIEEVTEVMNKSYEEFMSNYINKQKVIDVMENETINISGFECVAVEDLEKLLEDK